MIDNEILENGVQIRTKMFEWYHLYERAKKLLFDKNVCS